MLKSDKWACLTAGALSSAEARAVGGKRVNLANAKRVTFLVGTR